MLPLLAWEIESRGKDSWGVTNGQDMIKKLGRITDSWEDPGWEGPTVFHTRAASTGPKDLPNQHPFVFEKKNEAGEVVRTVVGVHNGIISNHKWLNARYSRDFTCDSMHIFAHIAEGRDLTELEGWGALVWFDDGELRFAKFNMVDFHVWQVPEIGGLVFCSTTHAEQAYRMFGGLGLTKLVVLSEQRYKVGLDGDGCETLVDDGPMLFGEDEDARFRRAGWWNDGNNVSWWHERYSKENSHRFGRSGGFYDAGTRTTDASQFGRSKRLGNVCAKCTNNADRSKTLLCVNCKISFFAQLRKGAFDVIETPGKAKGHNPFSEEVVGARDEGNGEDERECADIVVGTD